MSETTENPLREQISEAIGEHDVILFMKGTPERPMCGFSARTVAALDALGKPYVAVDVLPDPRIRQELSAISNWPTIPQLFVSGELVGGADIVAEMYESGELAGGPGRRGAERRAGRGPRGRPGRRAAAADRQQARLGRAAHAAGLPAGGGGADPDAGGRHRARRPQRRARRAPRGAARDGRQLARGAGVGGLRGRRGRRRGRRLGGAVHDDQARRRGRAGDPRPPGPARPEGRRAASPARHGAAGRARHQPRQPEARGLLRRPVPAVHPRRRAGAAERAGHGGDDRRARPRSGTPRSPTAWPARGGRSSRARG